MQWISRLEKRFGSWAIPNLSLYIILIQAIGVVLLAAGYVGDLDLVLHGSSVFDRGEWWRLLSFMMMPKTMSPIWLFFAFYIFYLMGNALEHEWGVFRFNLFILSGYLLTILMAVISPGAVLTNFYFLGCVFLAFATLFPNFELLLFFILPVKVKWLGWLTAGIYFLTLFKGASDPLAAGNKLCVLAAFINYLLFFGNDMLRNLRATRRRTAYVKERAVAVDQPFHVCAQCGTSDKSDRDLGFRYCSTCGKCFCEKHISDHEH